jgi:hypothetical protein
MTIKQVFEDEGVLRPHPPAKVVAAFKAGFGYGSQYEVDEETKNRCFYEWWEQQ